MKLIYPAIFHEDDDSIWVEFPDLEGCLTEGKTIEEAFDNAKEVLECYCLSLLDRGQTLHEASDPMMIEPSENTFVSLVETTISEEEIHLSV